MKQRKRILCLLLAAAIMALTAGCGDKSADLRFGTGGTGGGAGAYPAAPAPGDHGAHPRTNAYAGG